MIVIEVEKQSLNLIDFFNYDFFLVSYSNGHGKNFRAIVALIYLSDRDFLTIVALIYPSDRGLLSLVFRRLFEYYIL